MNRSVDIDSPTHIARLSHELGDLARSIDVGQQDVLVHLDILYRLQFHLLMLLLEWSLSLAIQSPRDGTSIALPPRTERSSPGKATTPTQSNSTR
jgi:hypothetical protein